MLSSDYWTGYKLCYFLNLTENCSVAERWFERPTITALERENCALDSARVQLVPTSRWWAIKAVFIWSCLSPRVDWILVSIPITILYLIVYAKYFHKCFVLFTCFSPSCRHAKHPYCMALLSSVNHACHCSAALISLSQSSLRLLPAITHWLDYVTRSQIQRRLSFRGKYTQKWP